MKQLLGMLFLCLLLPMMLNGMATCPIITDISEESHWVCAGEPLILFVELDNPVLAQVNWVLPDGSVISGLECSYIPETTCPEEHTIVLIIACIEDGTQITNQDFLISVIPFNEAIVLEESCCSVCFEATCPEQPIPTWTTSMGEAGMGFCYEALVSDSVTVTWTFPPYCVGDGPFEPSDCCGGDEVTRELYCPETDIFCEDDSGVWDTASCSYVESIPGCTNVTALNWDPSANCDDGTCVFEEPDPGCDDGICENGLEVWDAFTLECIPGTPLVDPGCDDGICENGLELWVDCECQVGTAPVDPGCDDGECANGLETWNGCDCEPGTAIVNPGCDDGICENGLELWVDCECEDGTAPVDPGCDDGECANGFEIWDGCDCAVESAILGCSDPTAINFDPEVSCDDGSCQYDTALQELRDQFSIFPNPVVTEVLSVVSNTPLKGSFEIINLSGQSLIRGELKLLAETQIDLSQLTSGVYFLVLDLEGQKIRHKFVKL